MLILYSPLEQFDIFSLLSLNLNLVFDLKSLVGLDEFVVNLDFSFTNSSLFMLIAFISFIYFFTLTLRVVRILPSSSQVILEEFFCFVHNLVYAQLGRKGYIFFPFIFSLFTFILLNNLTGVLSFGFVPTSHFAFTLFLSSSIWFFLVIVGFTNLGLSFLKLFVPAVPIYMLPLLVVLEVVSYILRMFSLSIRLSANILAGHVLMFILANFALQFNSFNVIIFYLFFVLFSLIATLEIAVAFIQAFVFSTLVCIYLSDSLYSHN